MDLSIVVPTHNRFHNVVSLLESFAQLQIFPLKIELIIVTNLSDPRLESWIQIQKKALTFPCHLKISSVVGVNAARNKGLQAASSDLIYFIDDDVVFSKPDHLVRLVNLAVSNPAISTFGGGYNLVKNYSTLDEVYHLISTSWLNAESGFLVGGNTLYNRRILGDSLKFNDNIKFGGAETELNLRLLKKGFHFKLSRDLNLDHNSHLDIFTFVKKAFKQGQGRFLQEKLVEKEFWKIHSHEINRNYRTRLFLELYDFFFHVGYRQAKSGSSIALNVFKTFFQIDSDKTLFIYDRNAIEWHNKKIPSLKFKEIHHWLKGNFWWKIPNYFFWKIIPATGNIFLNILEKFAPDSTLKIRKSYHSVFDKLEKKLMKND